jgi:hypothetical protein
MIEGFVIGYLLIAMCAGCRGCELNNGMPWYFGVIGGLFWPLLIIGGYFFDDRK